MEFICPIQAPECRGNSQEDTLCTKLNIYPTNSLIAFWPFVYITYIRLSWWACLTQHNKDVSGWMKTAFTEADDHSPAFQSSVSGIAAMHCIVLIKILRRLRNAEWIWFGIVSEKQSKCKTMQKWSVLNTKYAVTFLEAVYTVTSQTWDFCELYLKHGAFVSVWYCCFESSIGRSSPFKYCWTWRHNTTMNVPYLYCILLFYYSKKIKGT